MKNNILISGASIAGLSAAYWLNKKGFQVTVVEKDSQPRIGGSPIDVRGLAIEIVKEMGVYSQIKSKKTNTDTMTFVNSLGKIILSVPQPGSDKGDIEIQRDDLVNILYEKTKDKIDYLFSDSISAMQEDNQGINVTFKNNIPNRFDIVVGADGLHSLVRKLTFGNESEFIKHLGMYVADVEVSKETGVENFGVKNQGIMYNTTPGKFACIYRYNDKADLFFTFRSPKINYDYNNIEQQKEILLDVFKNELWEVPKLLKEVSKANRLYFDSVSQIKMDSWSKGRVVLIGDAAHCAAFLSGKGSTLAIIGAKFLADELYSANGDYKAAFAKYENKLRPIVTPIQNAVPRAAWLFLPKTKSGIRFRNGLLKLYSYFISKK